MEIELRNTVTENEKELADVGLSSEPEDLDFSDSELIQDSTHDSTSNKGGGDLALRIKSRFRKLRTRKDHDSEDDDKNVLKKDITLFSAIAYVVGSTIGSGIFITPKSILCSTGSFGMSMIVWTIGGMVAMAGGLCYVELALLIRKSGAEYIYIKETYSFKYKYRGFKVLGSLLGFLFIWSAIFLMRSASIAIITLACAQYLIQPFFIDCDGIPKSAIRLLALAIILILVLINCYSVKLSARVMSVLSVTKLLAVAFIVVVGVIFMITRKGNFPDGFTHPFSGKQPSVFGVGQSLYSVLFAYNGWNTVGYTIEETRNKERTVPLAILIGVPLVTISYLLVNVTFFAILSHDQILSSDAVALPFGKVTMGTTGLVLIPLLVSISAFGAANGSLYNGTRGVFVAAREGQLPGCLSGLHDTYKTPIPAILFQVSTAMFMVIIGTLDQLIQGYTFIALIFYGLSIAAVVILRFTLPNEPRIFKVWFITPIAVGLASFMALLVLVPLLSGTVSLLIALGILLAGIPVYILVAMETPWKLRPKIMDRLSANLSDIVNKTLNTRSTTVEDH